MRNHVEGPVTLSSAWWAHVNSSKFLLLRAMTFVAQLHRKKEYWLHLSQFMKPQDTQAWCITFAGGTESKRCPGNKYGTHTGLDLAAEVQWHLREKRSYSSCSEGPSFHHLTLACCLLLWTSSVQFTGKVFENPPHPHYGEIGLKIFQFCGWIYDLSPKKILRVIVTESVLEMFPGKNPEQR